MTQSAPRIGILETGRPPEALFAAHGDYPQMVTEWLGPLGARFTRFAVLDGVFPANPADADLWVITGSRHGAYEDHPWIPPLEDFIRACRDASVPMFGICFGHQIIAQALGGTVRKSSKGWGLGLHDYEPVNWPEALGTPPRDIRIQAFHQDQVESLPPGAQTIAQSDFCPHAALWYPGFAVTVQGHPEFGKAFMADLLESRKGAVLASEQADHALETVPKPNNRAALAELLGALLPPAG